MENKIYTLNEKGTNLSYGIVTTEILDMIKHIGLEKHLDIKEVIGSVGGAGMNFGNDRINAISIRTDDENLSGDTFMVRSTSREFTKEELIKKFAE